MTKLGKEWDGIFTPVPRYDAKMRADGWRTIVEYAEGIGVKRGQAGKILASAAEDGRLEVCEVRVDGLNGRAKAYRPKKATGASRTGGL